MGFRRNIGPEVSAARSMLNPTTSHLARLINYSGTIKSEFPFTDTAWAENKMASDVQQTPFVKQLGSSGTFTVSVLWVDVFACAMERLLYSEFFLWLVLAQGSAVVFHLLAYPLCCSHLERSLVHGRV